MVLPPLLDDPEAVRPFFRRLRELRDRALGEGLLAAGAALDGDEPRLRGRDRGGRDPRARRDRDLRRAPTRRPDGPPRSSVVPARVLVARRARHLAQPAASGGASPR